MSKTYERFGSPHNHEGDARFWTLRFDASVRARAPITHQLQESVGQLADTSVQWPDDQRVEIDLTTDLFDDGDRWGKVVSRVEEVVDLIHAREPLFAVVFADHQGLHEAPRATVELFGKLRRARGRNRARLVAEALLSDHPPLEDLALSFVTAVLGQDALKRFMARSPGAHRRAQVALSQAIRPMAFDFGKKPKPLLGVLDGLELELVSKELVYWIAMAAVRDAPSMGRALAGLAARNPDLYDALAEGWRALHSAPGSITLAFAEAERGHSEEAAVHLADARDCFPEAKSPLWKKTIPAWLDALEARLATG